jgi:hypothetical protein
MPEGADEDEFLESLVEAVEEMRGIVETVAGHWRGLGLDFDEDVQVNTAPRSGNKKQPLIRRQHSSSQSINEKMLEVLASNEERDEKLEIMELEIHRLRREANARIADIEGEHQQQMRDMAKKHQQLEEALADERCRRETKDALNFLVSTVEMTEMKRFLGDICKKLPRPQRVDVSKKWLRTRVIVKLVFVCPRTDKELEVESSDWSLWLKFAWSIVQTGNQIFIQQDAVGTVDAVKDMVETAYAAYHQVDRAQATLEAMKREPMLLSAERDKLIQGLRDAKFYDSFTYDDQTAEWFAT